MMVARQIQDSTQAIPIVNLYRTQNWGTGPSPPLLTHAVFSASLTALTFLETQLSYHSTAPGITYVKINTRSYIFLII